MCREKAVLNIQEWSLGLFRGSAGDQGEVTGFLRIARKQDAPAAIGNAVNVVVARVNVQRLGCQRTSSDMEDDRETFARNRIKNFLHQDEALARSEISHSASGHRKTLARAGGAMLGFRLDESQLFAPKIVFAISHFDLIPAAHRGGGGNRVCACTLRDVGFHPNHHAGAVRSCWNTRKWRLIFPGRKIVHGRRSPAL